MSHRIDGYLPPATGTSVDGYDLLVSAQSSVATDGYGGDLTLKSGVGSQDGYDGYVTIQTGNRKVLVFDGYNMSMFPSGNTGFSAGKGIIYIRNATTTPTGDPLGGGYFYVENGDGYWRSPTGLVQSLSNTRIVRGFPSDADYTAVQADYQAKIMEFTGAITATRDVIVPLTSGYQWTVFNNTSGAQSIRIIGATGTGITIANAMRAIVYADGTNIVRVTPDT
jgi:hypothetical protein